jgi:hypothetical protein
VRSFDARFVAASSSLLLVGNADSAPSTKRAKRSVARHRSSVPSATVSETPRATHRAAPGEKRHGDRSAVREISDDLENLRVGVTRHLHTGDSSGVSIGHPFSALLTASITHVIPIAQNGPELHH